MKKVTFLMALAVAAGMASCTAQSPKARFKDGHRFIVLRHRYGTYRRFGPVSCTTRH